MNHVERKKVEGKLSSFVQSLQQKRLVPGGGLGVCTKGQSEREGETAVKKRNNKKQRQRKKEKQIKTTRRMALQRRRVV
jgi:hypothetical protein